MGIIIASFVQKLKQFFLEIHRSKLSHILNVSSHIQNVSSHISNVSSHVWYQSSHIQGKINVWYLGKLLQLGIPIHNKDRYSHIEEQYSYVLDESSHIQEKFICLQDISNYINDIKIKQQEENLFFFSFIQELSVICNNTYCHIQDQSPHNQNQSSHSKDKVSHIQGKSRSKFELILGGGLWSSAKVLQSIART